MVHNTNIPGTLPNHVEIDPSGYPRTYQASKGNHIIWITMATAAAIGGLFGASAAKLHPGICELVHGGRSRKPQMSAYRNRSTISFLLKILYASIFPMAR